MTVRRDGDIIRLEGECRIEDAEPLVALLDGHPGLGVDLAACRLMHAAVLQALLFYGPAIVGEPAEPFLRTCILPNLLKSTMDLDARK